MRDDLKFFRKPKWLDYTVKKTPQVAAGVYVGIFDKLDLHDEVVIAQSITVNDTLILRDILDVFPLTSDVLNLTDEVIAELHPPRVTAHVEDTLFLVDQVRSHVDQSVADELSLTDVILMNSDLIAVDNLSLSDEIVVTSQTIQRSSIIVSDTLTLTDTVIATLQQQQIIIPDSYTVYNHNWQPVLADLSVWWDNDTQTTYNVYYSPPNPSNPRWIYLYFNNPITLPRTINIYIAGYTPNKTLYIYAIYYGEWVSTAVVTLTGTGWYSVELSPTGGYQFDEIEIFTDVSILGFIGIGEFHIMSS